MAPPNILEIPDELWVEIFRWIKPPKNEECSFFMIKLPMVCRRFDQLMKASEHGNFFYKFMYEKMFLWRDLKEEEENQNQDGGKNSSTFWFDQLKREIMFYRDCKFNVDVENYRSVQDRTEVKNNLILFKKTVGSSIASVGRPLRINTGCYYFECILMDSARSNDNIFFGIILENQSSDGFIGSDNNSIGYYFTDGSLYYNGKSANIYGFHIKENQPLGLLIDTNNLTLEYFTDIANLGKIDLKQKAPHISQALVNNNVGILPCVSMLYDNRRMKMKCFDVCSYDKCSWIQDNRQKSL